MFDRLLWHSPNLAPPALLCAAAAIALLLVVYRRQAALLRQPWNWMLPLLRCAAVVALAASVLRPAIVRPRSVGEYGAVVVMIDRSASMNVIDTSRGPAELVELADALGRLPAGARQRLPVDVQGARDNAEALARDLTLARGEFDYARLTGQSTDAAQSRLDQIAQQAHALADGLVSLPQVAEPARRLVELAGDTDTANVDWSRELSSTTARLDAELSRAQQSVDRALYDNDPQVRGPCDELGRMSRLGLVNAALTEPRSGLLPALYRQRAPVYAFTFADDVTPLPARDASGRPVPQLDIGVGTSSPASGATSDIDGALRAVRDRLMRGQPIQSIVLLSDGRQVGGAGGAGGASAIATSLSPTAPPVFTVSAAAPVRNDVAVGDVEAPTSLRAGQVATVRAEVLGVGLAGRPVEVQLEAAGRTQSRLVTLPDRQRVPVEFTMRMDRPGVQPVTVRIARQPEEATVENNAASRWISVSPEPLGVALLGGSADQEFQALRDMLARTPWVKVTSAAGSAEAAANPELSPARIVAHDVIILAGVTRSTLTDAQWQAVHALVVHHGGGLIVMPPAQARGLGEFAAAPGLAELLPFRDPRSVTWRSWEGEEPVFSLVPATESAATALRLTNDAAASRRRWDDLPAMYRVMPANDLKPSARALLLDRDTNAAVLTQSRVGAGRAFFFGADETWRWQDATAAVSSTAPSATAPSTPDDDHARFWLQLLTLAGDEPYALPTNEGVRADVDPPAPRSGARVRLRLRLPSPPRPGTLPFAQIVAPGGVTVSDVELRPLETGAADGRFEAATDAPPAGQYDVRFSTRASAAPLATLALRVTDDSGAELVDVGGDDGHLRRLARAGNGEMLRLSDVDQLPDKIRAARDRQPQFTEYRLWDSPILFVFAIGCLTVEWSARKWMGLA